jgi:hypothetical protein
MNGETAKKKSNKEKQRKTIKENNHLYDLRLKERIPGSVLIRKNEKKKKKM